MNNSFIDFQLFAFPEGENQKENWQGAGRSGVLILHDEESGLAAEDEAFLKNILQAAKLSPVEDQAYLGSCTATSTLPLATVAREHNIQHVFFFGSDPRWAGIQAQLPYYAFTRLGDLSLLRAHPLRQIREERQANKNQKAGALWNALKAKFL